MFFCCQFSQDTNNVTEVGTCTMVMLSIQLCEYGGINVNVFFFNDTASTEIYTLSLHDALPI